MNKQYLAGALALVILVGGYFAFHKSSSNTSTVATPSSSSASQNVVATITYTNNGFGLSPVTVKSGDTIAVSNVSSVDLQLESDPHPVHTDDTDLNVGSVGAGKTTTFTVTKKGTFGFHNHLNPTDKGTITIQ